MLQIKKPMIERKRRDRINESLNRLKTLVLDAMQKDVSLIIMCHILYISYNTVYIIICICYIVY